MKNGQDMEIKGDFKKLINLAKYRGLDESTKKYQSVKKEPWKCESFTYNITANPVHI